MNLTVTKWLEGEEMKSDSNYSLKKKKQDNCLHYGDIYNPFLSVSITQKLQDR